MSETPMTEARDVEEIVARLDAYTGYVGHHDDMRALFADWRAKKAEIERRKEYERSFKEATVSNTSDICEMYEQKIADAAEAMRAKCEDIAEKERRRYTLQSYTQGLSWGAQ